jgi:MtN3 and saliva related transmembrane protein
MITALGLFAAFLTTGALVPQVVKTIRTKSTGDLSLGMYLMMFTGTLCWLLYGFLNKDIPIISANIVASVFSFIILYFKVVGMKKK